MVRSPAVPRSPPKHPSRDPKMYDWLKDPEQGGKYKYAERPRNYLARNTPFPLNRSFVPPVPTSDATRNQMYNDYMKDPKQFNVRALAQRHHMSLKRVEAILRLKGLEASWRKEGKHAQTAFVEGMENILGIEKARISDQEKQDMIEADALDEEEGSDASRFRYQRMFWEPVVDLEDPIMPDIIEQARLHRKEAVKASRSAFEEKFISSLPTADSDKHGTRHKPLLKSKPGHVPVQFVDIGAKFLDPREAERRETLLEKRKVRNQERKERRAQLPADSIMRLKPKERGPARKAVRIAKKQRGNSTSSSFRRLFS